MTEMIAYCGLECFKCPVYLAGKNDDPGAREKVAAEWSKIFNWDLKAEDMVCDGCLVDNGVLFKFCRQCEPRKCCRSKGIDTCASCEDYACDKIKVLIDYDPVIGKNLEKIRKDMGL